MSPWVHQQELESTLLYSKGADLSNQHPSFSALGIQMGKAHPVDRGTWGAGGLPHSHGPDTAAPKPPPMPPKEEKALEWPLPYGNLDVTLSPLLLAPTGKVNPFLPDLITLGWTCSRASQK